MCHLANRVVFHNEMCEKRVQFVNDVIEVSLIYTLLYDQ